MKKPPQVSHDDLWDEIDSLHAKLFRWFLSAGVSLGSLALAAFIWVWSTYAAQASINADVSARVDYSYQQMMAGQERIENRLEALDEFLRDTMKEQANER